MFDRFFKKHNELDADHVAKQLVALIFNDEKLSNPIFIDDLTSEEMAGAAKDLPLIYMWSRGGNHLSVSINGGAVAFLLESLVPRSHPLFVNIRNKVVNILSESATPSILSTSEKLNAHPSVIFPSMHINNFLTD